MALWTTREWRAEPRFERALIEFQDGTIDFGRPRGPLRAALCRCASFTPSHRHGSNATGTDLHFGPLRTFPSYC
jgi:hypothetical protein